MKTLFVVAGANGSGKTTFAKMYSRFENIAFLNADKIAEEIEGNNNIKAGKVFFHKIDEFLNKDESFIIETTLSGKYFRKIMQKARNKGYHLVLIYLFLETLDEHIYRVRNRVMGGGHDVPEQDIMRRYYRSKKLFWYEYKNLSDEWLLCYNGDDKYELVADKNYVYDEILLNSFLEDLLNE
jgi:predicted ABC-type ATPase